ncbi:MAG: DUF6268 family outer membrane beta-barrel protein [Flavobacteriaceae bacterium]|nr:DUF6268 family outer membrane beta-barrel protein [Flavobacteriaceae bacterium]
MTQLKKSNVLLILLLTTYCSFAQLGDLVKLEYTQIPQKDSRNQFKRINTLFKYPIKIQEDAYLVPGISYKNVQFDLTKDWDFDNENIDEFHFFETTLGYTYLLKNKNWRVGSEVGVGISSNFETSGTTSNDYVYTVSAYAIHRKRFDYDNKKRVWILGIRFATDFGTPFPIPVATYNKQWRAEWETNIGVPKSNIKYMPNDRHTFEAFASLDGFYGNIQRNVQTPEGIGSNVSMTLVYSGLKYEYVVREYVFFYTEVGHTLLNRIRFRDGSNEVIFTLNDKNTFYFRTGIKVKI